MLMTVVRTGPRVVVKDLGRAGHAALGVAPSGAADRGAFLRANALVGNPDSAAALECTLGGLRVRFDGAAVVALTGLDALLMVDGVAFEAERAVSVPAGAEVRVGMPRSALRGYVAVRGGIAVGAVLGSRSTDAAGIGPSRPSVGDKLPIGEISDLSAGSAASPTPVLGGSDVSGGEQQNPALSTEDSTPPALSTGGATPSAPAAGGGTGAASGTSGETILDVDLGPREDWFTSDAVETFLSQTYTVTPASDTVGLRLDGPPLTRSRTDELPSEGVVRGAVQVPPDGRPIIFQADHPVTGGYPVIAVLTPEAADRAAQLRPGRRVRFTAAENEAAESEAAERRPSADGKAENGKAEGGADDGTA